ncbi:hypothetical protein [Acetobacter orleanensis]|uniref:hypothetical protein n=1 Tax=Acetobacter orleanensis TaxID=104099 RepID=UPI001470756C|nr:hypothetical protein [Acetobacter orleanensis]
MPDEERGQALLDAMAPSEGYNVKQPASKPPAQKSQSSAELRLRLELGLGLALSVNRDRARLLGA